MFDNDQHIQILKTVHSFSSFSPHIFRVPCAQNVFVQEKNHKFIDAQLLSIIKIIKTGIYLYLYQRTNHWF